LIAEQLARMRQAKQSSSMVDFNLKHKQKRSGKMEEKKRKKKQKSKIDKQLKRANVNNNNNDNNDDKEDLHDDDNVVDRLNLRILILNKKTKKTNKQGNIHLLIIIILYVCVYFTY